MLSTNLETCLSRIREREQNVHAWVRVKPAPPLSDGPLSGVPFGVKDIFATEGLATEWGSPTMAGRVPTADAALVVMLRKRGAIMVGKTHTTSFAYFDPAPTRNPHDPAHTPGGSSSGSAAAVAARMVPLALGSQTQGSVLRPASFCGCVGFKPTFGVLPLEGVMPFAPTLDTAGFFTWTAADMRTLWALLDCEAVAEPCQNPVALELADEVEPPMRAAFTETAARLGAATVAPPDSLRGLWQVVKRIQEIEGARTHREAWERHGAAVGEKLAGLIQSGLAASESEYQDELGKLEAARGGMAAFFTEHPVVLTPAALGPAPRTLASTGDPRMNAPWTGLGSPAISIPMNAPVGVLPLGLQIAAAPGQDALLLATACAMENE